jgi:hypothetical protein
MIMQVFMKYRDKENDAVRTIVIAESLPLVPVDVSAMLIVAANKINERIAEGTLSNDDIFEITVRT